MSSFTVISSPQSLGALLTSIEKIKRAEVAAGNKSDFLFRGQSIDEPLIPRLARLKTKGKSVEKLERLMMADFERQRLPFTEIEPRDAWDQMALAQHHGLPTRLLDWTYNALAALWFCVRKPPRNDTDGALLNGVVWLLKTAVDDFITFPTKESPYDPGRTRIFRPRTITRRIMAQSGVFTCHKRTKDGKFIRLESNKNYKSRLIKIPIQGSCFATFRENLMTNGISSFSLFPDLDGLAAHLERRYFHDAKPRL